MKTKNEKQETFEWMMSQIPENFDYLDQSGAAYTKEIQEFEGLLRPLWGMIPAYFTGEKNPKIERYIEKLQEMVEKKKLPTLSTENRQIAVEMGVLGYALGIYGESFLHLFSDEGRAYFVCWLNSINAIEFPAGNWYFFLVLVNGGLKKNHKSYSQEKLSLALAQIDSFYLGDSWYSDGPNQQRDYYVPFAFHFYGLLYSRISQDKYAEEFLHRAIHFADHFVHWFDEGGRSLPFGRSLTYRYAHVCYWSALIVTGAYKKTGLSLGEIKGLILRNFRFWQQQPITLPMENNLSIGYGYGNLLLSEDYNAPGSPMWAFKSFVLMELPRTHEFWTIAEEFISLEQTAVQKEAGFHIQHSAEQTTALSSRQFSMNPMLYHGKEKYGKFAYSTYFGFNLSREFQGIQAFAIDSTLAISIAGNGQYLSRNKIDQTRMYEEYGVSQWNLWNQVKVTTYLIPLSAEAHIRIHSLDTSLAIDTVEGGFPVFDWNKKFFEPFLTGAKSRLQNQYAASLIMDLLGNRKSGFVQQGPNTNIYSSGKNGVPTLENQLLPGNHLLACLVYGSPEKKAWQEKVCFEETAEAFTFQIAERKIIVKKENFNER